MKDITNYRRDCSSVLLGTGEVATESVFNKEHMELKFGKPTYPRGTKFRLGILDCRTRLRLGGKSTPKGVHGSLFRCQGKRRAKLQFTDRNYLKIIGNYIKMIE